MEFTGKTVEQAIEAALAELKIEREQAEIKILEEKGGLFKKARVDVTKKLSDNEKALDFVEKLFEQMGITAVAEMTENAEECLLNISTTETSAVIGKRGEVLDAVQYLACMVVNKDREDFHRIVLDCEGYRAQRAENLKAMAEKLAAKAIETGRRVQLDPMNPYERRIVHAELQKNEKVTTESRGTDPNRYVVIFPKDRKFPPRGDRPFNRDGGRGGFNRDNRAGGGFNRDNNRSGEGFNRDNNRGGEGFNRDNRGGGFNRDGRRSEGFSRDGAGSGDGNRERRYDNNRGGGFNRDRRDSRPPKKSGSFGFGTYLGNVNDAPQKDAENKDSSDKNE